MTDKVTPWQWLACVTIILLQVADMATTLVGLSLGGSEQNPIVGLFLQAGTEAFIAFKIVLALLLGYMALVTKYVVWILSAVYAVVVVNNISIIAHLS